MTAHSNDVDELWESFHRVVNMTSRELRDWLHSEPAQQVRPLSPEESTAHDTGHHVMEILAKRKQDLTDEDARRMRWVVSFVQARTDLAEEPDPADERRRHELMTVGHDPLKPR